MLGSAARTFTVYIRVFDVSLIKEDVIDVWHCVVIEFNVCNIVLLHSLCSSDVIVLFVAFDHPWLSDRLY